MFVAFIAAAIPPLNVEQVVLEGIGSLQSLAGRTVLRFKDRPQHCDHPVWVYL